MATNWDHSNIILANQAGAYLGQGIGQAGAAFGRGLERRGDIMREQKERERQEKERDRAMAEEVARYAGIAKAAGLPPGAVEAMGLGELRGAVEGLAVQMTQEKFRREKEQIDAENRRMAAEAARYAQNDAALAAAVAPRSYTPAEGMYLRQPGATRQPRIEEIALSYLQGGGRDQDVMKLAWEAMQREEAARQSAAVNSRVGSVLDIGGVPYVWTNTGQISPLQMAKEPERYFDTPQVSTVDGVQFSRPGPQQAWRPLPAQRSGSELNPILVGSMREQLTRLEGELLEHQLALSRDDKRYGVGNLRSRLDRIKDLEAKISGLRATLGNGRTGTGTARPPAASPATDAADPLDNLNW